MLELRNTKTELKDAIKRFNSRLGQAEERTGEFEDRWFEIIQSKNLN